MSLQFTDQEYKQIGLYVLRLLEFAENKIQIKNARSLLDIKNILETQYTDGITSIPEAYLDGDTITGIFEDQVSPSLTKRFNFAVTESEISYSLANPDAIASFSDKFIQQIIDFAVAKKKKNCVKGIACGGTCIRAKKANGEKTTCRKTNPAGDKVKQIKEQIAKTKGGDSLKTKKAESTKSIAVANTSSSFLKPVKFNPYAVNLTPQEFNKFRDNRDFIGEHKSKDFIGNQSYEQWKGDRSKAIYSTSRYKAEILKAVSEGYVINDDTLQAAKIKLTKQQQKQLADNKTDFSEKLRNVEKVQKAIDHPLVDAETAKNYKSKMTEEEANQYTKDSFTGNLSFYHGNKAAIADDIENSGAKPEKNARGVFGQGFYLATNEKEARHYAVMSGNEDSAVVATKTNVKNPLVTDSKDWGKLGESFPGEQSNGVDAKALTEYVKSLGHDSIYLKDFGYFVALDRMQVVTYRNSKTNKQQAEEETERAKKSGSNEDVVKLASESETGKALNKTVKRSF